MIFKFFLFFSVDHIIVKFFERDFLLISSKLISFKKQV